MTTATVNVERESGSDSTVSFNQLKWDATNEQDRERVIRETCELITRKSRIVLDNHKKLQTRISAIRNTATQVKRKADLLHGQSTSLENTARNLENRLDENAARMAQINKAAFILESMLNNGQP